jgi:hypothetical protein
MSEMNIHDFLGKIDWEGGVYEALQYGLKTNEYDLPQHLVDAWNEIRDAFDDIEDLVADWNEEADKFASTIPFEEE